MQQPGPPQGDAAAALRERYAALFEGPELLPWQLDLQGSRLLLALMDEPAYRSATFLDQRLNQDGRLQAIWAPLQQISADALARGLPQRPANFLFHIGHCGSTLLTRLLGEDPRLLPLREPLSLRTLAESERLIEAPSAPMDRAAWEALSSLLLSLLARSYRGDQRAFIKPSSNCNNLIAPVLASHPEHKAVFLYLNLQSYLASLLRPQSRNALYVFANDRVADLKRFLPGTVFHFEELAPARLGALNWTASMGHLVYAQSDLRVAPRLRAVEFEDFLKAPATGLMDLFRFLGTPVEPAKVDSILASGYLERYAKDLRFAYTPSLREADLQQSMQVHRGEIDDAVHWLKGILAEAPGLTGLGELLTAD